MLEALTTLVLCQFVGEVLAQGMGLPVPGPVVGLVLLLVLLMFRGGPDPEMKATSYGLLRHLSLLFVPAGVGVVTQLGALRDNWLSILGAVAVSTTLGLAVTGWVMQRLSRSLPE